MDYVYIILALAIIGGALLWMHSQNQRRAAMVNVACVPTPQLIREQVEAEGRRNLRNAERIAAERDAIGIPDYGPIAGPTIREDRGFELLPQGGYRKWNARTQTVADKAAVVGGCIVADPDVDIIIRDGRRFVVGESLPAYVPTIALPPPTPPAAHVDIKVDNEDHGGGGNGGGKGHDPKPPTTPSGHDPAVLRENEEFRKQALQLETNRLLAEREKMAADRKAAEAEKSAEVAKKAADETKRQAEEASKTQQADPKKEDSKPDQKTDRGPQLRIVGLPNGVTHAELAQIVSGTGVVVEEKDVWLPLKDKTNPNLGLRGDANINLPSDEVVDKAAAALHGTEIKGKAVIAFKSGDKQPSFPKPETKDDGHGTPVSKAGDDGHGTSSSHDEGGKPATGKPFRQSGEDDRREHPMTAKKPAGFDDALKARTVRLNNLILGATETDVANAMKAIEVSPESVFVPVNHLKPTENRGYADLCFADEQSAAQATDKIKSAEVAFGMRRIEPVHLSEDRPLYSFRLPNSEVTGENSTADNDQPDPAPSTTPVITDILDASESKKAGETETDAPLAIEPVVVVVNPPGPNKGADEKKDKKDGQEPPDLSAYTIM